MKQQRRGILSKQAVLQAALCEFVLQGYGNVTVDLICSKYNLSKGMVYHYFTGKDDLFLSCARQVFSDLADTLQKEIHIPAGTTFEKMIEDYYLCRQRFFEERQQELIFFQSVMLSPPPHLQQEVENLRSPLKEINRHLFSTALEICSDPCKIHKEDALRYLETIEKVFWKIVVEFTGTNSVKGIETEKQQGLLLKMLLHGIF